MKIYVITCSFNISQTLIDCAFQNAADANAYTKELNSDKAKAVARCKELIAERDNKAAVKFLDEKGMISFVVTSAVMK